MIDSMVILKYLPRADSVTHKKIRDKGDQQRQGNYKYLYKEATIKLESNPKRVSKYWVVDSLLAVARNFTK